MEVGNGTWQPLGGAARQVAVEILLDGPLSRAELARRVRLSAGSLTRISKPMLESGLLVEVPAGPTDPRVGRPTQPLDIVPDSHHFVGVKLSGDAALGVLTTLRAEVLATEERPLPDRTPDAVAKVVVELTESLAAGVPRITGLGVSLGGNPTRDGQVDWANFLGWQDVPFGDLLAARTDVPVVLSNDLTAVLAATHWFGAGRGYSRFCLITIGAGIGYGVVVHDKPVETAGGGLVSHVVLDPDGPPCGLGHRGCAAALLTTEAITSELEAALGRPVGYDEGLDLAKNGNPAARRVISTSAHALGRLIAVATNFTMPELVVLGGEGVQLAAVAYDDVLAGLRSGTDPAGSLPPIALQEPTFTEWARGAAVIAIQTFILGEEAK